MSHMLTDEKRAVIEQVCPRKRFLTFHLLGHGIEQTKVDMRWAMKHYIRVGVFYLLKGVTVETAVDIATKGYLALAATRGLNVPAGEDAYTVATEQVALVEAAIRGFYLERYTELTTDYEVVAVESENVWNVTGDVEWMSKPDALLKQDETYTILRIKVVDRVDEQTKIRDSHAMRAISDPAAVAASDIGRTPETRIEYIAVGQRRGGVQHSPLVRGYIHRVGMRLAPKRQYTDSTTGAQRKLGNDWEAFSVWKSERVTLPEWVAFVGQKGVLAELYQSVIINPPSEEEIRDWREQIVAQESTVYDYVEAVFDSPETLLNTLFPQHRHACDQPYVCEMQPICFGYVPITDPLSSGEFVMREPEYNAELVQIQEVAK